MNATEGIAFPDKLRLRAIEVERTIRHLEKERQEVEENTEWINRAAYESRARLLDSLTSMYRYEMSEIEQAQAELSKAATVSAKRATKPLKPLG
jgi:hypothetical protein